MRTRSLETRSWNIEVTPLIPTRYEGKVAWLEKQRNTLPWEEWLLRAGISPHAGEPVSRIGIYTDFT